MHLLEVREWMLGEKTTWYSFLMWVWDQWLW